MKTMFDAFAGASGWYGGANGEEGYERRRKKEGEEATRESGTRN